MLTSKQLATIEQEATELLGDFDSPTPRFVGKRLEGLFNSKRRTQEQNRTTLYFDFTYENFHEIIGAIKEAVTREPHILWQFVVTLDEEIPLDFVESLIVVIHHLPSHWLDRLISPLDHTKVVARRLFVKIAPHAAIGPAWRAEAEELLGDAFH